MVLPLSTPLGSTVYITDALTGEVDSRMLPTASIFSLCRDMASKDTYDMLELFLVPDDRLRVGTGSACFRRQRLLNKHFGWFTQRNYGTNLALRLNLLPWSWMAHNMLILNKAYATRWTPDRGACYRVNFNVHSERGEP